MLGSCSKWICSRVRALWHRDGEAPLPVRWVLLCDPSGKRSPFALLCTDPTVDMLHIITWYVFRWNIEVTFLQSSRSSGPLHPAAQEYSCRCSDHPLPAGVVQSDGPAGTRLAPGSPANSANGLVCQSRTHLCRCPGCGSPLSMGLAEFANPTCSFGVCQFV
jgi:hypothetical protein